jgi:hypothetical protein
MGLDGACRADPGRSGRPSAERATGTAASTQDWDRCLRGTGRDLVLLRSRRVATVSALTAALVADSVDSGSGWMRSSYVNPAAAGYALGGAGIQRSWPRLARSRRRGFGQRDKAGRCASWGERTCPRPLPAPGSLLSPQEGGRDVGAVGPKKRARADWATLACSIPAV